jgi:asparagine synthase (glutamine-hydrolysing)
MCGIAGIVNFNIEEPSRDIIERMTRIQHHRGPDDEGFFLNRHVALGHVRLSIIDIEGSRQPLCNEDGTIWVVFNGEIYNFQEIRPQLLAKGHCFKTKGDTEVLVHLYEEYGSQMVNYLRGMFAFAIWDGKKQQLFAARDRMGIKPFYYCLTNGNMLFASEPKAILQHPDCQASPDPEGIWHYLTYRSVPAPGTLFRDIRKLKQGHWLIFDRNGWTEKQYWEIPLIPESTKNVNKAGLSKVVDEAEGLLLKAVQLRLISDVPLGAFLSGGVDSSLIVAMMRKLSNAPVKTYSVGFRNFPTSELPYAKSVAELFQTDHHELVLEEKCFADNLEKLTWMRDSPLTEKGDVPLYLLAKMASEKVKVLLSGEGSDELFGGYPKYACDRFAFAVSFIPKSVVHFIGSHLPSRFRRVEIALRSMCEKDMATRWSQWFAPFTAEEKVLLLTNPSKAQNPLLQYVDNTAGYSSLDRMLYADCKIWLVENLLERGDRMTMAASIEGRVPFLDHKFVEFAFGLPTDCKIRGLTHKWLIKEVAHRYLPDSIVTRRKIGFDVPLTQWFRGKLRDMCYDRICNRNGLAAELLKRQELEKILDDHCSGHKDNFLKIWTLLGLSIWYDIFCNSGTRRIAAHYSGSL